MLSQPIPAGSTWGQVKLAGVVVSSGQAEIGVTSSGQTVTLDDFTLIAE